MNILNVFPILNSIYCDKELPIKYFFNQCPPSRIIVPDLEEQIDNEYELPVCQFNNIIILL